MRLSLLSISISSLFLSSIALAESDATWKTSQSDFGGTGLLQTPTGRMASEGEFNIGVNINDDYHHYMVSLQLMDWLETTIRYTRVPDLYFSNDPSYSGDNLYTDKGVDFKIRLIEESYWLPETSIGVRDFGGTGLFDGEFIAATKRFGPIDFSFGLGWDIWVRVVLSLTHFVKLVTSIVRDQTITKALAVVSILTAGLKVQLHYLGE